jgi:hypothetical protein
MSLLGAEEIAYPRGRGRGISHCRIGFTDIAKVISGQCESHDVIEHPTEILLPELETLMCSAQSGSP